MSPPTSNLGPVLKLYTTVQQTPPDHKGGYTLAIDAIVTEAATYEEAKSEAERTVPDGWRILSFRAERYSDPQ
jgi:hypothetical protein